MSDEARDWLQTAQAQNRTDTSDLPLQDQRKQIHDAHAPAAAQAVIRHNVTISEKIIAGVPCLIIDPAERKNARTILYLFGGAFISGSPFEDLPISAALAAKTGAKVISPQYRLAPEHPFLAALDDIEAVAKTFLSDNANTVLAGESAGANLALALTHRLRAQKSSLPKALALLSPAADLGFHGETTRTDTCNDPTLSPDRLQIVEDYYVAGQDVRDPEISPIYGPFDVDFPACFITTGTRDMLLSSCVRLTSVLRGSGVNVDLRVWEGMWHVFEFYPEIPESDASLSEIAIFLKQWF